MYFPQANETQDPSDMSDPSEVTQPQHMFVLQGPGRYIQVPWYIPVQPPIYSNYPVDPNHPTWIAAPPYGNASMLNGRQSENDGNETESNVEDERTGATTFPPPGVGLPTASTMQQQPMYQMMPPFSNVYVGSIPSGVSVQGFVNSPIPYPHPYPGITTGGELNIPQNNRGTRGSSKVGNAGKIPGEKGGNTNDSSFNPQQSLPSQESSPTNDPSAPTLTPAMAPQPPPHPQANFVPLGPVQYSYSYFPQPGHPPPPPHLPSAQHATGSPLYIPHPSVPMYHTPIYNSAPAAVFPADNTVSHSIPVSVPPPSDISANHETESASTFVTKELPTDDNTYKNSNLLVDSLPFEPESQKNGNFVALENVTRASVHIASEDNAILKSDLSTSNDIKLAALNESAVNENFQMNDISLSSNETVVNVEKSTEKTDKPVENVNNILFMLNEMKVKEGSAEGLNEKDSVTSSPEVVSNTKVILNTENIEDGSEANIKSSDVGITELKNIPSEGVTSKSTTSQNSSSGFDINGTKIVNITAVDVKNEVTDENTLHSTATKTWASLFKGSSLSTAKVKPTVAMSIRTTIEKTNNIVTTFSNQIIDNIANSSMSSNIASVNGVPSIQSHNKVQNNKYPMSSTSLADDTALPKIGELLKNYKLDHRAVNFEPRGLENRSNYCYVNAILQALLACPPFYNLMKCISHNLHNSKTKLASKQHFPIIDSMVQFVDEFKLISQKARRDIKARKLDPMPHQEIVPGKPFEPHSMYSILSVIQNNSVFAMGQQEDAQEFLTCLLNGLNDEMVELIQLAEGTNNGVNPRKILQPVKIVPTKNNKKMSNGDISSDVIGPDDSDSEWKQVQSKIKPHRSNNLALTRTPLSEIFRGQMRSRLQKIGDQATNNIEPFFTLHLNIEKANSVKEALELLVGRDALEGVTSSRTNQEVDAWQQQTLEELPYVLLLHLKYFDYKHHACTKIMKLIEFPIDLKLEIKLISTQSSLRTKTTNTKSRQYKLFAVVYHDGKEASKGHYITDVFHIGYGGWIRYDDSRVCTVSENDVLKPKLPRVPYLLYYRRCDTIAALMQPPFEKR